MPSDKLTMPGTYEVRCFNAGQEKSGKARGRATFDVIGESAVTPRSAWGTDGAPQTEQLANENKGLGAGMSKEDAAKINNLPAKESAKVPASQTRQELTVGVNKGTSEELKADILTAAGVAADTAVASGASQQEAQEKADAKVLQMQPAQASKADESGSFAGGKGAISGPLAPKPVSNDKNMQNPVAQNALKKATAS